MAFERHEEIIFKATVNGETWFTFDEGDSMYVYEDRKKQGCVEAWFEEVCEYYGFKSLKRTYRAYSTYEVG